MFFWRNKRKDNEKESVNQVNNVKEIRTLPLCSASEIGKYVINRCLSRGYNINTMKLQKLLILAYGEHLHRTREKLFEEKIEISSYGPMIKKVDRDFIVYTGGFDTPFVENYALKESQKNVIDDIITLYGSMDAFEINDDIRLQRLKKHKNNKNVVNDPAISKIFDNLRLIS